MTHAQHHDIVEEPGTYRSNFACFLGIIAGIVAIALGVWLTSMVPGLGYSTIGVGALAMILFAGRLWGGLTRWASIAIWLLGVYSWYSPAAFGISPSIFEESRLGICWAEIGIGLALLFLGIWTALGAPGKVEHESFWYPLERSAGR